MTTIPQKRCSKCTQFKPATKDHFPGDKNRLDGLYPQCKQCRSRKHPSDVPDGSRRCKECKEIFPATDEFFQKGPSFKCGLDNRCRVCRNALDTIYRGTHREELRVASRAQYAKDLEHSRAQKRASYYTNKDTVEQYKTRPEVRERNRLWHVRYYKRPEVKESYQIRRKRYYSTHKEETIARSHKRLARQRAVMGTHTAQEIREQYQRQKGRCYYCSTRMKPNKFHRDHVIPLSREGSSNHIHNIVLTCAFCNISKGSKLPHEWPKGGRLL